MRVIKNINNNISLCLDNNCNEVVAFGKGIGFKKPPYEIPLSQIERTFYDVNEEQLALLNRIPEKILKTAAKIVDYANQKMDNQFGGSVVFLLADHIDFAIQRLEKHINLQLPLFYEVKHLYPQEAELARVALEIIQKELGVKLPKEEQAAIALHFVNFQLQPKQNTALDDDQLIEEITLMLQRELKISINRDGFNYYRFVSHLHYLMERTQKDALIATQNSDLFESFRDQFPDIYYCAAKIAVLLHKKTGKNLNDEEILYLMLHINRLYAREDCEQSDSGDQTQGHT